MALQSQAPTMSESVPQEQQLFAKYIYYVNASIINIITKDELSTESQYKPNITNVSLSSRFYQYIKLITSHQSLPPIQHEFALNLFHDLVEDIDKYILTLVESLFGDKSAILKNLIHKTLISQVLTKSFAFTFKLRVFNQDVHNQTNIITSRPLLFYGNDLIEPQSKFKELIYSFYGDSYPSPKDDLLQIAAYFKVDLLQFYL